MAMDRKLEAIAAEALQLTVESRAALAKRLLESLDGMSPEENDRLWVQEAARRYQQLMAGKAKSISSEEVFSKLKARRRR
jgi:putative addiction module component (TIGR02574 family)